MGPITEERVLRFVLPALAAALMAPLPQAAAAQEHSWRDESRNDGLAAQIRHAIGDHADKDLRAFYDARGGEVLTRTAGTFFGGAVTHLTYYWPAGKSHQRRP